MKVLQIALQRYMRDTDEPVMLSEASDLSSFGFFQRATCQQLLNAFSKIVVKRIQPGQRITVEVDGLTEYQVHIYGMSILKLLGNAHSIKLSIQLEFCCCFCFYHFLNFIILFYFILFFWK